MPGGMSYGSYGHLNIQISSAKNIPLTQTLPSDTVRRKKKVRRPLFFFFFFITRKPRV